MLHSVDENAKVYYSQMEVLSSWNIFSLQKRKMKDGMLGEKKVLNSDAEKAFKKPKKPLDKDKLAKK